MNQNFWGGAQDSVLAFTVFPTALSSTKVNYLNILPTAETPINPDSTLSLGGISGNSWVFSLQDVQFYV